MSELIAYAYLADLILAVHALFVLFVGGGLLLILLGLWRHWAWVRNRWFRLAHLAAIGIVVAQAWVGSICPLTILENIFRQRAGEAGYAGSFMRYWVQEILFYQADPWVFVVIYTVFAGLVVLVWILAPPGKGPG